MALAKVSLCLFLTHEFREYTAVLNPQFVPRRLLLASGRAIIKEKIVRELEGSVGASVTVDIWSGKCIKDSLIAATIHYIGEGSLKNAFLGLKRLNGHHDAQTIKRGCLKILNSMGINESSIYRMVTDSDTNIVRAFKNEYETGNSSKHIKERK
ncbi:unnamed protein product [Toxocara canis]|uniref:Zinc finger BED domain-containing protein 5 n=1 Tax=Toxocara canis TaxID=6265 RepID=A0A183VCM9_TOXCA|nr:unnamed protein product [Toxocara canis]